MIFQNQIIFIAAFLFRPTHFFHPILKTYIQYNIYIMKNLIKEIVNLNHQYIKQNEKLLKILDMKSLPNIEIQNIAQKNINNPQVNIENDSQVSIKTYVGRDCQKMYKNMRQVKKKIGKSGGNMGKDKQGYWSLEKFRSKNRESQNMPQKYHKQKSKLLISSLPTINSTQKNSQYKSLTSISSPSLNKIRKIKIIKGNERTSLNQDKLDKGKNRAQKIQKGQKVKPVLKKVNSCKNMQEYSIKRFGTNGCFMNVSASWLLENFK